MRFSREDEKLGVVATSLLEKKGGSCPTDEEFALFTENKLSKDKRKDLISHFVSCPECRERLAIPSYIIETENEEGFLERLVGRLSRPLIIVPAFAVFIALTAITLSVYLKSRETPAYKYEERMRGENLVALEQVELTPALLNTIKKRDNQLLKTQVEKELPPGSEISTIVVEEHLTEVEKISKGDQIILLLYADGVLKVKLESK